MQADQLQASPVFPSPRTSEQRALEAETRSAAATTALRDLQSKRAELQTQLQGSQVVHLLTDEALSSTVCRAFGIRR